MTLQELHDETARLLEEGVDPNLLVYHEGCDCVGTAGEICIDQIRGSECVYITRV